MVKPIKGCRWELCFTCAAEGAFIGGFVAPETIGAEGPRKRALTENYRRIDGEVSENYRKINRRRIIGELTKN
jgi:hypothetical protein